MVHHTLTRSQLSGVAGDGMVFLLLWTIFPP